MGRSGTGLLACPGPFLAAGRRPPVTSDAAARFTGHGIQLLAETNGRCLFARGVCIALVERTETGFGSIGSTGLLTGSGLAYLVWRDGRALLAAKGVEMPAEPEQVEAIRQFSRDLKEALAEAAVSDQ